MRLIESRLAGLLYRQPGHLVGSLKTHMDSRISRTDYGYMHRFGNAYPGCRLEGIMLV